jgi:hypothetical protein
LFYIWTVSRIAAPCSDPLVSHRQLRFAYFKNFALVSLFYGAFCVLFYVAALFVFFTSFIAHLLILPFFALIHRRPLFIFHLRHRF